MSSVLSSGLLHRVRPGRRAGSFRKEERVTSIQPVIITPDLGRLQGFYETLLGAVELRRVPADGPTFYVGLKVGDAELGLVADAKIELGGVQRMLLSVDVVSVDDLLEQVEAAGGRVLGPPSDMPWGQRVAHVHDPDGNTVNLTQSI
jgi:predicted enzyme related to lactoylglutathione lyase